MADEMVFAKTGQHFDDLQEAILRGTIQCKKYTEIAEEIHCNESYVRQVGSQLWEILSEVLGEDVNKKNFRSAIQRFQVSNVSNFTQNIIEQHISDNFNVSGEARYPLDIHSLPPKKSKTSHQDLSGMPDLGTFFDRTSQLDTLTTWILQQHSRLITITGVSGIGKTSLAVQLVKQLKDEFEYAVWYALDESLAFDKFQSNLIQIFSSSENPDSSLTNQKQLSLINYLQNHRCLVVLDDIHNLFRSGEFAGKYKPESTAYRSLFKQIEKLSHQSCLLLIGWEPPQEVPLLTSENTPIRTLQLAGLDSAVAAEILRDKGLAEIERYEALINCYQGNPLWLKSVATLIQELGLGATELFLNDPVLLPDDLKDNLQQQFDRLSEFEKQVILILAKEKSAIDLAQLVENTKLSLSDLLNAVQSLLRRCSIKQQGRFYTISPVLRQYATIRFGS